MKNIVDKIKKAPESPGVYLFKNRSGHPLYIGRSVNLKERTASYLISKDPKVKALLKEAYSFSFVETDDLLEAVIKEVNLIKQHLPKYNVKEKDDRSFIYIEIDDSEWPYPKLKRERVLENNRSTLIGPFKSLKTAKDLLLLVRKVFPYSTCKKDSGKPCFHRQINLCPGKCTGEIKEKEYRKIIKNMTLFLKDKRKKSEEFLKKNAPERLELLKSIDDSLLINRDEGLSNFRQSLRIEGYDVTHFGGKNPAGAMVLFRNGDFDKNGYRIFKIKKAKPGDDIASLKEVIRRRIAHKEWEYPNLILVDGGRGQVNAFENILSENKVDIPVIGISKYKGDKIVLGKLSSLPDDSDLFNLLKMIRDEVHRFSNAYRKRSSKIDKQAKKS